MAVILPPIERQPTAGERFGAGLGAGLLNTMDYLQKLGLQRQKAQEKQKSFDQIFNPREGELTPQQETILALQDPSAFNAYKNLKESRMKESEEVNKKENLSGTLNEMTKTLLEGNIGYTPSKYLTSKGRRDRQYFDSLNTQLESIGKDLVSKGVLSAPRFAFLLSTLPSSDKTDAENAGAIQAWAKELGIPEPEGLRALYEDKKPMKKQSSTVHMIDAQGNEYDIPRDMVSKAKAKGFKIK